MQFFKKRVHKRNFILCELFEFTFQGLGQRMHGDISSSRSLGLGILHICPNGPMVKEPRGIPEPLNRQSF